MQTNMSELEVPDKGYAWVIVVATGIINLILSGMARMIGYLYVAIIETYRVPREEASVPFTVRNAVRYLTGPIVGLLGDRFGIRNVTFCGGVIATVGSVLCCIAPTVTWIVIFWGGIHGFGFSMGNTLFQVLVNQYFEKHRATASGIVLSFACAGSFVLPTIMQRLIGNYGLVGCFLLLGGIFLHVLPASLVLRPPPWIENPEEYAKKRALYLSTDKHDLSNPTENGKETSSNIITERKRFHILRRSANSIDIQDFNFCRMETRSNFGNSHRGKIKLHLSEERQNTISAICTAYRNMEPNCFKTSDIILNKMKNPETGETTIPVHYIQNDVPERSERIAENSNHHNIQKNSRTTKRSLWESMKKMIFLYTNVAYILISISVATYFWAFLPVLTVVVDYARDKGIPESYEVYLIYSLTIGDLLGRLGLGWVTDRKFISLPGFMALVFILQGVFIVFFPFVTSLYLLMAAMILYGIMSGTIFVHFPVLVYKYIAESDQSIAMGSVGMFSGIVTFGIPPLIGVFRDNVGSYDGLFYIIAAMSLANGCLWLLVPFCKTPNDRQSQLVDT